MKQGEYYKGSTEALESLFGKIKYMEREQRAFGFASLLLTAMSAVDLIDVKQLQMQWNLLNSDIDEWSVEEIGRVSSLKGGKSKR